MRGGAISCLAAGVLIGTFGACSGGGKGGGGTFRLIQFLEDNQANVPRNRVLTFKFSSPVAATQAFAERLKIQNVQTGAGGSNFSLAIGNYVVSGDTVMFRPRLPNAQDRGDAGFKANANYVVFLKGGPDSLLSASGGRITSPQEFGFVTNQYFEDPIPTEPPRAAGLVARDVTNNATFDLSRLDPRPGDLANLDSAELIANQLFLEPGGGANFGAPWQFELTVSEPIDPATVTTAQIEMFEVYANATTSGPTAPPSAPPGYFGDEVLFRVPLSVSVSQGLGTQGVYRLIVTPIPLLVDNTRYRLRFSGSILGIDFRREFIGDNGLTGDGQTVLASAGLPYPEPGGLGYTTEFIVRDRPAISAIRTLTYEPLVDGVLPELGQTAMDESRYNSSLYNPPSQPGTAVGFLSAFGQGVDGDLAVAGGITATIDTGDTPNDPSGNPFVVRDLNPNDEYLQNPLPGADIEYDTPLPFELQLTTLTVSSGSTLRVIGMNPLVLRVTGIVQINGAIDVSGGDGQKGGGAIATPGAGGPAGFMGGNTKQGVNVCTYTGGCSDFSVYLNACSAAAASFPHTLNGHGPGRGYAGGEAYNYDYNNDLTSHGGTGGGGGSHAGEGDAGEDVKNVGGSIGTPGPSCSVTGGIRNSGVIGVRGQSGPTYGDREVADVLLGGSGGGGGGSTSVWGGPKNQAGGAGGGGGGSISIVAAGPILGSSGVVDASGGAGGDGAIVTQSAANSWHSHSGGGGGGSGGTISMISGASITLTGTVLDARGGTGGLRGNVGTNLSCSACNGGGAGGKGFIFLMDADGEISGLLPGLPGEYDDFPTGVLTISQFETSRFSSISAVTELYPALAADPTYQPMTPDSLLAFVSPNQTINVFASSAKADMQDPLVPDITTETTPVEIAEIHVAGGSIVVDILNDLSSLNPGGGRDAFLRIEARFDYQNGVEAALGPFAYMDRVDVGFTFND